jgi:hypothetical protein
MDAVIAEQVGKLVELREIFSSTKSIITRENINTLCSLVDISNIGCPESIMETIDAELRKIRQCLSH